MANIKIRGQSVDIDIRAEIEQFNWSRPRWSSDKLIAASPFRHDNTPSFYVHLIGENAGCWGDSGYYDEEWAKGGLVKLLAFLRNETTEETEDHLLAEYCRIYELGKITLRTPTLKPNTVATYLPHDILTNYAENYDYLLSRGIDVATQRQARIQYDGASNAVVIPWFDANSRLCNVKYRQTRGKVFWYAKGAVPIRTLVYGIDRVTAPVAVLEEAEIDALSWTTVGVQGIAVGGANFTDDQADIIKRSPIKQLYISGDNDKAGQKFAEQVANKLRGYVDLRIITKPTGVKDTNEALVKGINTRELLENAKTVKIITDKLT